MSGSSCSRTVRLVAGSLAMVLIGTALAAAQTPSLAEVARREEERRKTLAPATKVLTNKDLPKVAPVPAPVPPPASSPPGAAPVASPEKPDGSASDKITTSADNGGSERDEAWWRARMSDAKDQLDRTELVLEALQTRVNLLAADFMMRDPAQATRAGDDRQKALTEIDRTKVSIADLKKQIEGIEEDARKAGVPPGWLR